MGYDASISRDRAVFTSQLIKGACAHLREHVSETDVALLGMPPSGLVTAARRAVGKDVALIADIRDLWPDALAVGNRKNMAPLFTQIGRAFSQEVRQADAVTAVTDVMRDWAPASTGAQTIPIGMSVRDIDTAHRPPADAGLRCCFISNHTHGFDFDALLTGWQRFSSETDNDPLFSFIGASPSTAMAQQILKQDPTVRSLGVVAPSEVANTLAGSDVGVNPSTPEWAYSLGNKIFDYLSVGHYVLHTLEPSTSAALDDGGLGHFVGRSADDWHRAFEDAHGRRQELRSSVHQRVTLAEQRFGPQATSGKFIELMEQLAK